MIPSNPLPGGVKDGLNCRGLGLRENLPVGGRLKFFLEAWRKIGASKRVLRWIRRGYPLRFKTELSRSGNLPKLALSAHPSIVTSYSDPLKQEALVTLIRELEAKQCITRMAPGEEGYFSRVFLVPKKSGGYRLVIDLSQLNKSLAQIPFSMDTLHLVKLALKQGMWATSLDLSDAYHHIPMRPSSQVYLCFHVGNVRYKYLVLPFGLSSGPWLFTEVVRQVKKWAWKKDFALFQYLDDWLNLDLDKGRLHESTQRLVTTCQGLGLLVNIQK